MAGSKLPRALLVSALLFALAYGALVTLERDPRDRTDEPQWIAISLVHVRQLFGGEPPPAALPGESPWRAGVQSASFGAVNPCVPKLIWGAALAAAGHPTPPAAVFPRFNDGDTEATAAAERALEPALPLARAIVRAVTAFAAVCLFWIGCELGGTLCGALALALFLLEPLVRLWGGFVRTDFFPVAFGLAALLAALELRVALAGGRGLGRQARAAALVGLCVGLAIGSKLNSLPLLAVACVWCAGAWWRERGRSGPGPVRGVALPSAVLVASALCVVFVTSPVLWSAPLAESRAILAFWDEHMAYQQERAAKLGVVVTRTLAERLSLIGERTLERDEPLAGISGLPGGVVLLALGVLALLGAAVRRPAWLAGLCPTASLAILAFGAAALGANASWLPLDWDRYFLTHLPFFALAEAALVALILRRLVERARTRGAARLAA